MRARLELRSALLCAAALLACQSPPPPAEPAPAPARFDAERAWADLERFAAIGPRVMGSEGAAKARAYIASELRELELQTERLRIRVQREAEPPLLLENLAAVIPGESSDLILLMAPYDTRAYQSFEHRGVNEGGSGAAVLLELARSIAREPLPYTVWFAFLDGEAPIGPDALAVPSHFGSRGLARRLVELDTVAHIRLGVMLDRVCDADLEIARDLGSHRIYREEFWRSASRIGRGEAFPSRAAFQSPRSSQEALKAVGVTRIVTLTDTSFGGDEPPGLYAGNPDDTIERCSKESLETVGLVTLETLDTLSGRLARIDRFSRSPVEGAEALRLEQLSDEDDEEAADEGPAAGEAGAAGGVQQETDPESPAGSTQVDAETTVGPGTGGQP